MPQTIQKKFKTFLRVLFFSSLYPSINSTHLAWEPPDTSWFKLKCDRLAKNKLTRIEGCLRDASRNQILGYSSFSGEEDVLLAELKSIHQGLLLTSQVSHVRNVIVESDSSQCIFLLEHCNSDFHPFGTIIENCKLILSNLKAYIFQKSSRQQNRCTDLLAKEGKL